MFLGGIRAWTTYKRWWRDMCTGHLLLAVGQGRYWPTLYYCSSVAKCRHSSAGQAVCSFAAYQSRAIRVSNFAVTQKEVLW